MTALPTLRDIVNDTPADAVDVQYNFQALQTFINANLINADGSVSMTGQLTLVGTPTTDNQAASKAYVDSRIPTGVMMDFAGSFAVPSGYTDEWELCDGRSVSTTDPKYAALFGVIGYRHGGSGGSFNLPDYREAVAVGASSTLDSGDTGGNANDGPLHDHGPGTMTVDLDHTHPSTEGDHNHNLGETAINLTAGGSLFLAATRSGGALSPALGRHSHTYNAANEPVVGTSATAGESVDTGFGNYPPFVVATKLIKL